MTHPHVNPIVICVFIEIIEAQTVFVLISLSFSYHLPVLAYSRLSKGMVNCRDSHNNSLFKNLKWPFSPYYISLDIWGVDQNTLL